MNRIFIVGGREWRFPSIASRLRAIAEFLHLVALLVGVSPCWADAVDRLRPEKLKAMHDAIEALRPQRHAVSLSSGYDDARTLLHVHSAFSHDSRGTVEEIIKGAKEAGVRVIMFNEHPSSKYNYFLDGHRGLTDGVLFIPGAETGGFLAYPRADIQARKTNSSQEFADLVRSTGGLIFLCHLEERMDWEIVNLTGTEIYNTHADVKNETRFLAALHSPLMMLSLATSVQRYPQEVFGALSDYPADYLHRYDELCQKKPLAGVSANDAHHNQHFLIKVLDGGALQLEDALGEVIAKLDAEKLLPLKLLTAGKKAGDIIFELDLDPYGRSFHHVSTHLLLHEVTEQAVWEALTAGRAYVAFDWLADPTGFVYLAECNGKRWQVGSEIPFQSDMNLRAEAPFEARYKVLRDGVEVANQMGRELTYLVAQPGVYRVEAWLNLAGEDRPWILTNPIYVRAAK